jgi:uncharacterized protein YeaC (DUF1315 family)
MKKMNFFEELDRRTAEQAWADFCQLDPESKQQFVKLLVMNSERLRRNNQELTRLSQEMCFVAKKSMAKSIGMSAEEIEQYVRKE